MTDLDDVRTELVRSRGFIRAAETQLTKALDALDAATAPLTFGVHSVAGWMTADPWRDRIIRQDADLGSVLRTALRPGRLRPDPDTWDWTHLDDLVETCERHSLTPLLYPEDSPEWLVGPDVHAVPGQASWTDWLAFHVDLMAGVADRYGSRIEYELWNEPNLDYLWSPVDPHRYAEYYKAARAVILEADSDAVVTTCGLSSAVAVRDVDVRGDEFLRTLYRSGAVIDVVSYHPYADGGTGPDHESSANDYRDTEVILAVMDEFGSDARLWLGEYGWSRDDVSAEVQADYLTRSVEIVRTEWPRVDRLVWFLSESPWGDYAGYTLREPVGSASPDAMLYPAGDAWKAIVDSNEGGRQT